MDRVLCATEFKAKCLACLREIELLGTAITITKRGRPVAVLGPVKQPQRKSSRDSWAGKIQILGDIVNADTTDLWEAVPVVD